MSDRRTQFPRVFIPDHIPMWACIIPVVLLILFGLYLKGNSPNFLPPGEKIVSLAADDARFLQAKKEAQASLPHFISLVTTPIPTYFYSIKAPFREGNGNEHMWVSVTHYEDGIFYGELANIPVIVKNVHSGDRVRIDRGDAEDWTVRDENFKMVEGGYTIKAFPEYKEE
jgi:uncharacterized protein YegJ (DUF2314 family)